MKRAMGLLLIIGIMLGCGHSAAPAPTKTQKTATKKNVIMTIPGLRFVKIPAGSFQMGSSRLDREKANDEMPRHRVRISHDFYFGVTEVTVSLYRQFLTDSGRTVPDSLKNAEATLPIANVSWQDTRDFIQWLNRKDTHHWYRLPTEAEWEYVCRAGTSGVRFFEGGIKRLSEYGWYWKNSAKHAHPVGKLKANPWGVYDMYGNVYEWVSDWYNDLYYQESPETDPKGPDSGLEKVYRGGGWSCNPDYCRSAFRNYGAPDKKSESVGFRLVMTDTKSMPVH